MDSRFRVKPAVRDVRHEVNDRDEHDAEGGDADVTVTDDEVIIVLSDRGPGIPDVSLAMQEGYSTARDNIRALGFGAGMGLPNMKKYTDSMEIETEIGVGTKITMKVSCK